MYSPALSAFSLAQSFLSAAASPALSTVRSIGALVMVEERNAGLQTIPVCRNDCFALSLFAPECGGLWNPV
jgi:hypothetical protein